MRCHYVIDKKAGKVLIPGCYGSAISGDINDCYCPNDELTLEDRIIKLEKKIKLLEKIVKTNQS